MEEDYQSLITARKHEQQAQEEFEQAETIYLGCKRAWEDAKGELLEVSKRVKDMLEKDIERMTSVTSVTDEPSSAPVVDVESDTDDECDRRSPTPDVDLWWAKGEKDRPVTKDLYCCRRCYYCFRKKYETIDCVNPMFVFKRYLTHFNGKTVHITNFLFLSEEELVKHLKQHKQLSDYENQTETLYRIIQLVEGDSLPFTYFEGHSEHRLSYHGLYSLVESRQFTPTLEYE